MSTYSNLLKNRGLLAFLVAQFVGAFNDNVFKTVLSLLLFGKAAIAGYLSLASILLILPSIIFSGYAGYTADKFSKRTVLVIVKCSEIVIMAVALIVLPGENHFLMMGLLFILATHTAFFSTAKYGILPELIPRAALSRMNGLLEMSTYLAIIFGTVAGGVLIYFFQNTLYWIGMVMLIVACLGLYAAMRIDDVPPSNPQKSFSFNPFSEIIDGYYRLRQKDLLFVITLAISYFWGLGLAIQLNIYLYSKQLFSVANFLATGALGTSLLNSALAVGIGMGGLIAGKASGDKIETGIVPVGAFGISLMLVYLVAVPHSMILIYASFLMIGFFAGFFVVPLNAMLQYLPSADEKGRMIATNNFLNAISMLLGAISIWLLHDVMSVSPTHIFETIALGTVLIAFLILYYLPDGIFYFILWFFTHTFYRVKTIGAHHIPETGPALIVCNHVTYIDGLILTASQSRKISFMVLKSFYDNRFLHWFLKTARAIPISPGNKSQVGPAIQATRDMLLRGHVVCIFAEGALSRTGHLLPFRRGLEHILDGYDIPIIPAHLGRLWDSMFAPADKKMRARLPHRISVPITVSFGKPMSARSKAWQVRLAVQEIMYEAQREADYYHDTLPIHTLKVLRYKPTKTVMVDSKNGFLKAMSLVSYLLLLSRFFRKRTHNKEVVGVLLPPGVENLMVMTALATAGCIAITVPYTRQISVYDQIVKNNRIRLVITSRLFVRHLSFLPQQEMLYFEDILQFPWWMHNLASLASLLLPASVCIPLFGRASVANDPVVIVFGRSVDSKGVMLSHRNILSNCAGLEQILPISSKSRFLTNLPTYSALGVTCCLWFPLLTGMMIVAHDDYTDYSLLVRLLKKYKVTITVNTPGGYQRMIEHLTTEDLSLLKMALIGGGKVSSELWHYFHQKFGVEFLEGYGRTELGPIISVNTPNHDESGHIQQGNKAGTVGQPLPGVAIRIVHPQTFTLCEVNEIGTLQVKSPGMMLHYWNSEPATLPLTPDGWFDTGQLAHLDPEGFISFTDNHA